MNAVVFEHVPVAELPPAWREKLAKAAGALVTVRIEEEVQAAAPAEGFVTDDPAFGIWRDREDMADVAAYVRKIREPRGLLRGRPSTHPGVDASIAGQGAVGGGRCAAG